jgi:TPR repeat protein
MAVPRLVREPDPNLVLAAQAGDVGAMKALAACYDPGDRQLHERWVRAAAESGDPEAMYWLSDICLNHALLNKDGYEAEAADWLGRAAHAGWPEAMRVMSGARGISAQERELWLRRAAQNGDRPALVDLARWAKRWERLDDAEHWYRMAMAHRVPYACSELSSLLAGQGRLSEAEECVRPEAEAGSVAAAGQLADVLHKLGRTQEAATWRETYEHRRDEVRAPVNVPELATVAATALVTTAVVPFVQALISQAAQDAYGQARRLIRRMLHRNQQPSPAPEPAEPGGVPDGDEEPSLLIAEDPETGITLFVWSNASDEALRALSSLDMGELTARRPDQGRVRIVWHPDTGTWHLRGE